MPAKKAAAKPAPASQAPAQPQDEDKPTPPDAPDVMVVTTTEEPVRAGGHILTENGWVPEDN